MLRLPTEPMFVHATNAIGLGASHVAWSVIETLSSRMSDRVVDCVVPTGFAPPRTSTDNRKITIRTFRRMLPNHMSRFLECYFSRLYFPTYRYGLVLGDIPLRNIESQLVVVHHPQLLSPEVNPLVENDVSARMRRWMFKENLRFASAIAVQSAVVEQQLARSYPQAAGKIVVVPQPAPLWFRKRAPHRRRNRSQNYRLFYPAAGYPHKNHALLRSMAAVAGGRPRLFTELVVTLTRSEEASLAIDRSWIKNVGRLNAEQCIDAYRSVDVLFFPSVSETLGLPLIEAMMMDLAIVCADLPYAHWLCEDQAIYFRPDDPVQAWAAIEDACARLEKGWRPDWTRALSKLPDDWRTVVDRYLEILNV